MIPLTKVKHLLKVLVYIFTGFMVVFTIILFILPVKIDTLILKSRSSVSYQESCQRIDAWRRKAPQGIISESQTIFMDHGQKVERVIVFFHGFTNSPRQFKTLAKDFYQRGYNVFIPRIPHHGVIDPNFFDLENLTAEELAYTANEAIDIARGLGEEITVVGLSMGGVMAGWAAQFRADVDLAVSIAPNFGTYRLPNIFLKPTINFMSLLRNRFIWWDAELKQHLPRPTATYVGFSSRALGEIRRLGWSVQKVSKKTAPRAKRILMITNANDKVVSQEGIGIIVANWKRFDHGKVLTYEFPLHLNLGHDLIDPQQTDQNTAVVYPQLTTLIEKYP